jgi:hypothetical protein
MADLDEGSGCCSRMVSCRTGQELSERFWGEIYASMNFHAPQASRELPVPKSGYFTCTEKKFNLDIQNKFSFFLLECLLGWLSFAMSRDVLICSKSLSVGAIKGVLDNIFTFPNKQSSF